MEDRFTKMLWELGTDSPELQEAIAKTITSPTNYSIPTRKLSPLTGELEDIHITAFEIEDTERKERVKDQIRKADNATVKDLAVRLNILHLAYRIKEARGETLTPQERTLKDLDITALAYTLLNMNAPREAYKTYETGEEYKEERARIIAEIEEAGDITL